MKEKKKAHGVQLLIRAVVRDPDGKIITDTGRKPSKSFVIQFLEFVRAFMDGVTTSATDLSEAETGIYSTLTDPTITFNLYALVNDSSFGVQVGTGETAESNTDFKLATQLTEGVGAGNITHGASSYTSPAVVGANVDMEFKRAFTNLTGSTITVKEAGIVVKFGASPAQYHLIIRDVLAASVDVPDKCSLTVIYTFRTTV